MIVAVLQILLSLSLVLVADFSLAKDCQILFLKTDSARALHIEFKGKSVVLLFYRGTQVTNLGTHIAHPLYEQYSKADLQEYYLEDENVGVIIGRDTVHGVLATLLDHQQEILGGTRYDPTSAGGILHKNSSTFGDLNGQAIEAEYFNVQISKP